MFDGLENINLENVDGLKIIIILLIFILGKMLEKFLTLYEKKQEAKNLKLEAAANKNINDEILRELRIISQRYSGSLNEERTKHLITITFLYAKYDLSTWLFQNKEKKWFCKEQISEKIESLEFLINSELDFYSYLEINLTEFVGQNYISREKICNSLTNITEKTYCDIIEAISPVFDDILKNILTKIK